MRKIVLFSLLCFLCMAVMPVFADGQVVGDKTLVDTAYDKGLLINLNDWFNTHQLAAGAAARGDKVFDSPRSQVLLLTSKGPIPMHYHQSADEIVYIVSGNGEMFIDGKWIPVKKGDLHVNPRGIIHATRIVGDEELRVLSIFTPPQANGNDRVMVKQ